MPGPPDIHAALDAVEAVEFVGTALAVGSGNRAWAVDGTPPP